MLLTILNKAILWQSHSQDVISDLQKQVLNTYLDGYTGNLKGSSQPAKKLYVYSVQFLFEQHKYIYLYPSL